VGSDTEVPDDVAAEFSMAFCAHLILAGKPLGKAFQLARVEIL
jgi:hypothetical protein